MLTRSAVAKRLGKSIATVRRLEGHGLFPVVDARGVHRFPERQVQAASQRLAEGHKFPAAQGGWLRDYAAPRDRRKARVTRRTDDDAAQLIAGVSLERHLQVVERAICRAKRQVAMTLIDICGERQLRRLDPAVLGYLEAILED